jgi:hypothetical protein
VPGPELLFTLLYCLTFCQAARQNNAWNVVNYSGWKGPQEEDESIDIPEMPAKVITVPPRLPVVNKDAAKQVCCQGNALNTAHRLNKWLI